MQRDGDERPYWHIFESVSDGLMLNDLETGLVLEANPAASDMHGYAREEFSGLHPRRFMPPDTMAQFDEWVAAVRAGKTIEATVDHVRRDGTQFTVSLRGTGCIFAGRLCLLSVLRDVSERVRAEQMLQQQVAARTREQATLLEISQTLASALDLKPGLILDQLQVIIAYRHAVLFVLEGPDLAALAARGPQALVEKMPFHIQLDDDAGEAALLKEQQPQRIADVWSDDPAALPLRSLLEVQAPSLLVGVHALMWVPLAVKSSVIGAVLMARAKENRFTAHDARLALTMANQAAITLVNAQLFEQAQALAALQERQRLAQNLHDAVNQSLFSAGLIAEVLPRLWERDQEEARRSLKDLRRLTRGALAEMRGLLAELRPQVLIDSELGDLLRQLGSAFSGRTNIPVSLTVESQRELPADVQVSFYRLCQEAFNNIAKHAKASLVTILLKEETGTVELLIRDNGRGFTTEQIPSGHYGLSMMRERAEAVDARLIITSRPGEGTEIGVRWTESGEQKTI